MKVTGVNIMVIMAVCGLGYEELAKHIEEKKCYEAFRLHDSPLNKHGIIFRNGGTTYCYGRDCPHASQRRVNVDFQEIRYMLNLTSEEQAYLKSRKLGFMLDSKYVGRSVFSPTSSYNEVGWAEVGCGCAIPMRPMKFFAEEGDIIIFEDYDESGDGVKTYYTTKESRKEPVRVQMLCKKMGKDSGLANMRFTTDRFCTFDKDDLGWSGVPNGVIIKHPKNTPLSILDDRFNVLRWGVMGDYITRELPKEACWALECKLDDEAVEDIIQNPENIRSHLEKQRIYLSAYHKKQTKLAVS